MTLEKKAVFYGEIIDGKPKFYKPEVYNMCWSWLTGKFKITIQQVKKIRTIAQNSTYWMWLAQIAEETQNTPEEIHEVFKQEMLPRSFVVYRGKEIEVAKTSKKLSTKQFTEIMMERAQKEAAELGIKLKDPDLINLVHA